MPEVAPSALSPTVTETVRLPENVLLSVTVAVTVTVAAPPFSAALDGAALRSIPAVSSSVSVIVADSTVRPVEAPLTEIVSSSSTIESSVGVSVNVAVPLVSPAAMSMSKPVTAA